MFTLSNKVAIITGGIRGIGFEIAKLFSQQEAKVYVLDINIPDTNKLNDSYGIHYIKADVRSQSEMINHFNAIFDKTGSINILVNNAGVAHIGTVEQTSEEDFQNVMDVNVKGVYNCLYASIPLMKQSNGGSIINLASITSTIGLADRFLYSATKAAVWNMTMTVAKDYINHNIRSNSISPARIHTKFVDEFIAKHYPDNQQEKFKELSLTQPIGRMGRPEEVAKLALFLASDESSFITGSDYPIDGGFIKLNT